LPDGEKIPHWFPYQLRHTAATVLEEEHGLDEAQAQLGHRTANTTKRYSKAQLKQREKLARNRQNPLEMEGEE
jgi:integrase